MIVCGMNFSDGICEISSQFTLILKFYGSVGFVRLFI